MSAAPTRTPFPIYARTTVASLHDTEVYAPEFVRVVNVAGSHPPTLVDLTLGSGSTPADVYNCLIHDVGDCFLSSEQAGGVVDACLYYNNGWKSTVDRTHGFNWYAQNNREAPPKVLKRSVLSVGFLQAKFFTSGAGTDKLQHIRLLQNIFLGGDFLIGSASGIGADDIEIDDCALLECHLLMGYISPNASARITNSLIARKGVYPFPSACVQIGNGNGGAPAWEHMTFRGNTLVAGRLTGAPEADYNNPLYWNRAVVIYKTPLEVIRTWDWDYNLYYSRVTKPFIVEGGGSYTFAEWQAATGLDAHSTLIAGDPPAPIIKRYDLPDVGRVQLAIVNPQQDAEIPLPDGLASASVRDIRNYPAVYTSDHIRMSGAPAVPLNWTLALDDEALAPPTFPFYGAFILEDTMTFQEQIDALQAALTALQAQYDADMAAKQAELDAANATVAAFRAGVATLTSARTAEVAAREAVDAAIAALSAL